MKVFETKISEFLFLVEYHKRMDIIQYYSWPNSTFTDFMTNENLVVQKLGTKLGDIL